MNNYFYIHQLHPAHSGLSAWVVGKVIFYSKTMEHIRVLMEDAITGAPFLVVFPLSYFSLTSSNLLSSSSFIAAFGKITAHSLEQSDNLFLYTLDGENFILWDSSGNPLSSSQEQILDSLPLFDDLLNQTGLKKDSFFVSNKERAFLSPTVVLCAAKEANLHFSPEEIQTLCYKLYDMVDFASTVIAAPHADSNPETFHPHPFREDTVQPSFSPEEILSNSMHIHGDYFVVPTPFSLEA